MNEIDEMTRRPGLLLKDWCTEPCPSLWRRRTRIHDGRCSTEMNEGDVVLIELYKRGKTGWLSHFMTQGPIPEVAG